MSKEFSNAERRKQTHQVYDTSEIGIQYRHEWRASENGKAYKKRERNKNKHGVQIMQMGLNSPELEKCCNDTKCDTCYGLGLRFK